MLRLLGWTFIVSVGIRYGYLPVAYHNPLPKRQSILIFIPSTNTPQVYGPHISILYASTPALTRLTSLGHFFNPSSTLSDKLGLAGSNYELTSSLPSLLSYFSPSLSQSFAAIEAHEGTLQGALLDYLNKREDVTVIGEKESDTKKRVSTVSFVVKGRKSQDVVEKVDEVSNGDMGIRWGTFYSVRLAREVLGLGDDGVVRVSMVHYNTCKSQKILSIPKPFQRREIIY